MALSRLALFEAPADWFEVSGRGDVWMSTRDLTLAVWAVIGLAVVACLALSAVRPRLLPTFGRTTDALVSSPWWRALLTLGWMWLGWHLFAR
jgi:hypothetical protein